jgi:hypothetical protein
MGYNTEAFLKYSSMPKWRERLYSFALIYVWFCGLWFSASNGIHAYVVVLCALFNGCMVLLVLETVKRGEAIKEINTEAVRLKEELDWVKAKYLELEKKQKASPLP